VAEHDVPLSAAQRSRIRRLSRWKEPDHGEEAGELNIIPYLDIIMNIIVFVIATLSVVLLSTIDTTPPSIGSGKTRQRLKSKALNLTVLITNDGLALKTSQGQVATGCAHMGSGVTVPKVNSRHDTKELTRCARELKRQNERYESETQVTITANNDVDYQTVISVIDALRRDERGKLFPDVHFGVARQ
jgi:biopolymer transport protein ExbD